MRIRRNSYARFLKDCDRHFSGYCWELIEKRVEGIPFFQIVEEILDRYACSGKDWCSALNLRVDHYDGLFHRRLRASVSLSVAATR